MNRTAGNRLKLASTITAIAVVLITINFTVFPQSSHPEKLTVHNETENAIFRWYQNNSSAEGISGAKAPLPVVVSHFSIAGHTLNSALILTSSFGATNWGSSTGDYTNSFMWYTIWGYVNGSILQNVRPTSVTLRINYSRNATNSSTDPIYAAQDIIYSYPFLTPTTYVNVTPINGTNYLSSKVINGGPNWYSITGGLTNQTSRKNYSFTFPFVIQLWPAAINRTTYSVMEITASLNGLDSSVTCHLILTMMTVWT